MKKAYIFFCLLAMSASSFAQSVSFGLKAGLNISSVSYSGTPSFDNGKSSLSTTTGFHVGAFLDIGIVGPISIQPALLVTTKGYSYNQSTSFNTSYSQLYRIDYFEFPLNILYNIQVKPAKIFFGGGPYAAYAPRIRQSGFDKDYGINILAGIKLKKHFSLSADYGLGLSNISSYVNLYYPNVNNRVFSISLGYSFN